MDDTQPPNKITLRNMNQLLFSYKIGSGYFALLVPAMALYFSQDPSTYKKIFTYYFLCMTVLQMIPGVLVRRFGLKQSMMGYALIFIIGTVIGYYHNGDNLLLSVSRIFQAIGLSVIPFFTKVITQELPSNYIKASFIQRVLVSSFSGPTIIILFGLLLHFYSWQSCFLVLGVFYVFILAWLCFFFKETEVTGLSSIKQQVKITYQFIKQCITIKKNNVVLFISLNLFISSASFLSISYAFVFHSEYHLSILFVSMIPMIYAIASIIATSGVVVLAHFKLSDKKIVVTSALLLSMTTLLTFLSACLQPQSWGYILAGYIITSILLTILYIYINTYFGFLLKQSDNNIPYNVTYYLSKNIFPMIVVFIWSFFKNDHISTTGILVFMTTLGFVMTFFISHKLKK